MIIGQAICSGAFASAVNTAQDGFEAGVASDFDTGEGSWSDLANQAADIGSGEPPSDLDSHWGIPFLLAQE